MASRTTHGICPLCKHPADIELISTRIEESSAPASQLTRYECHTDVDCPNYVAPPRTA